MKKTSKEWQEIHSTVKVLDPDGWDRENYQYSWYEEEITEEEYMRRRNESTCTALLPIMTPYLTDTLLIKECRGGACSEGYKEVFWNGTPLVSGYGYHNKIHYQIEGIKAILNLLKIAYELKRGSMDCKFYCE